MSADDTAGVRCQTFDGAKGSARRRSPLRQRGPLSSLTSKVIA